MDCIWIYHSVKAVQIGSGLVNPNEIGAYLDKAKMSKTLNPTYKCPLK